MPSCRLQAFKLFKNSHFHTFPLNFKSMICYQLCVYVCVTQSYLTLQFHYWSQPGSSVHAILQARILEWVAILFSRGFSQSRDQIWVSCIENGLFTIRATREVYAINFTNTFLRKTLHFILLGSLFIRKELQGWHVGKSSLWAAIKPNLLYSAEYYWLFSFKIDILSYRPHHYIPI